MTSQVLMANESEGDQVILSINHAKKIIEFTDQTFKYDRSTIVYSYKGEKIDIKRLDEGMMATPVFDHSRRFVGHPTVQKIYLKTMF